MLFLLLSIVWACFGQIDIVGVAQGKIVPSGRVKIVQSLEPGIVKAIHVVEGQRVNAGELLIELVNTKTQAALTRLSGERQAYAREKNRITDQLTALDTFQSPTAYFDNISLGSARKPTFGAVFSAHRKLIKRSFCLDRRDRRREQPKSRRAFHQGSSN